MLNFTGVERVYAYCMIIGGTLFIVRLILTFLGMGDHHDVGDHGGDLDQDHPTSDADFKLLSLQGFMAFLLVFGMFGLAASRSSKLSSGLSFTVALAAGLLSVWLIGRLFSMFSKFQHAGNIDLASAIGETGTVYLTITPQEMGKVTIPIQGRLMTVDASPMEPCKIDTGTQVTVHAVLYGRILLVAPLK